MLVKIEFDYDLALKKMKTLFGVKTVILGGGPTINDIFYNKNFSLKKDFYLDKK